MKLALFRRADGIVLAVAVVAALLWLWLSLAGGNAGTAVVVETPTATATYPLDKPAAFQVKGNDGIVLDVKIEEGGVQVINSTCPDHICMSGVLSRGGQSAVCVPAGISLRVVGGTDAVDGVTG